MPLLLPRGASAEEPAACDAWDIDYLLAANLMVKDTTMGAGDGVQPVGPGKLVLRVKNTNGLPAGPAQLLNYELRQSASFESKALFLKTTVHTDLLAVAKGDACAAVADGKLEGHSLRWTTPVKGMRADGTITCSGSFCGTFGAPPSGTSERHDPPHPIDFKSFEYSPDFKTFTMGYSVLSRSDSPKQTTSVSLAGRERHRSCVVPTPCKPPG